MNRKDQKLQEDEIEVIDHQILENRRHLVKVSKFMIDPQSKFLAGWDIFNLIFTLYISISVPFIIGFDVDIPLGLEIFEYFLDVYYIIDFGL